MQIGNNLNIQQKKFSAAKSVKEEPLDRLTLGGEQADNTLLQAGNLRSIKSGPPSDPPINTGNVKTFVAGGAGALGGAFLGAKIGASTGNTVLGLLFGAAGAAAGFMGGTFIADNLKFGSEQAYGRPDDNMSRYVFDPILNSNEATNKEKALAEIGRDIFRYNAQEMLDDKLANNIGHELEDAMEYGQGTLGKVVAECICNTSEKFLPENKFNNNTMIRRMLLRTGFEVILKYPEATDKEKKIANEGLALLNIAPGTGYGPLIKNGEAAYKVMEKLIPSET